MDTRGHSSSLPLGPPVVKLVLCTLLGFLAACEVVAGDGPGQGMPDATAPDEWSTLIEVDWTLEAGTEDFICALRTIESDLFIQAFRADAPPGTHHTVLTVTEPHGPDRVFPCDPGTLSDAMIFASGFGTDDLAFPDGVAIRVPAGKQLLLNLHLVNPYPTPLSGRSGTLVQTVSAEDVVDEAEVVFAGTADFSIPPNTKKSATGSCVFEQDATLLSLWPHMHQHGRHMVVEHHGDHGVSTLHDEPFSFYHQVNKRIEPMVVRAGERIDVTCSWYNTSNETVVYGDTANKEMCFAGLYRYPAFSKGLYCDL
jgi:hypothetical protein